MNNSGRLKTFFIFTLLIFLFSAPVIMAWFLVDGIYLKKVFNSRKNGELISMFLPMSTLNLQTPEGKPLQMTIFDSKWVLLYLNDQPCELLCKKNLASMKQLQKALGTKAQRLELLWVKTAEPTATELTLAKNDFQILLSKSTIEVSAAKTNHFYLADPSGNIMLSYKVEIPPELILDDMKRLL